MHLRLGSHAEKEYFEKMVKRFDGITVGANLLEATPGATASLLVKLCAGGNRLRYQIDPMTYAFGGYVDPGSGRPRDDLDWIKSDQKVKGQKGKVVRAIKSSYLKLSAALGTVFAAAIRRGLAVQPDDLSSGTTRTLVCESVLEYQRNRIKSVFLGDSEYKDFADEMPQPEVLWAPYFYIEPSRRGEWTELTWLLAAESVSKGSGQPVYAVLCAPRGYLLDPAFLSEAAARLPETGVSGVWLWFSQFDERDASEAELVNFKKLVSSLCSSMAVYNLHGGYFSMALCESGISGIAHGIGYGEQKDVVPVIGQSTPTVRYYLPALHARFGVPDIERTFTSMGVKTPADFFEKICGCVLCRGVIASSLSNFAEFGERHLSTPLSKRAAQTPAAAKRCRFHFLLSRLRERDWIRGKSKDQIVADLQTSAEDWEGASIRDLSGQATQIARWARVIQA
ncbi:MAG: hypothetical protein C0504_10035 [Candidatus Solibacter sp.]|nr:hypothetical protein [Candidatus Solibacter sp.]